MIKLMAFSGLFLLIPYVLAADNVDVQQPTQAIDQPMRLDLSIPEKDLDYKPDTSKNAYQESKEDEAKRQHCADLSRQIDALKGKFKPTRRSALINQHRAECMNKESWQNNPN
jgi:hypothetical protein